MILSLHIQFVNSRRLDLFSVSLPSGDDLVTGKTGRERNYGKCQSSMAKAQSGVAQESVYTYYIVFNVLNIQKQKQMNKDKC